MPLCPAAERVASEIEEKGGKPCLDSGFRHHLSTCPVCSNSSEIQIRADRFKKNEEEPPPNHWPIGGR